MLLKSNTSNKLKYSFNTKTFTATATNINPANSNTSFLKPKNNNIKKWTPKKKHPIFPYKYLVRIRKRNVRRFWSPKGFKFKWRKQDFFFWKKRKVYKRNRHVHNFFFMMCKKKRYSLNRYNPGFMKYQKYLKKSLPESRLFISKRIKYSFKIRWSKKRKRYFKLALAFKHIFKRYYGITENQFKKLRYYLKKKTSKAYFLVWFFEGRLATISVRFHFFWTVKKASRWIAKGVLSVNNLRITKEQTVVKVNDFINLLGPMVIFAFRFMKANGAMYFHAKFYKTINFQMHLPNIFSVIVLRLPSKYTEIKTSFKKRTKSWIRFSTFLYLANSFY